MSWALSFWDREGFHLTFVQLRLVIHVRGANHVHVVIDESTAPHERYR